MDKCDYIEPRQIGGWLDDCPNHLPTILDRIARLIPDEVSDLIYHVKLEVVKGPTEGIICWKLGPGMHQQQDLYQHQSLLHKLAGD